MRIDPVGELLRSLDHARPAHGVQRPHDGDVYLLKEDTLVALCLFGEARGEGRIGMDLVGCVIRNRVRLAPRFGKGWRGVVMKPLQFSCFNAPGIMRSKLNQAFAMGQGPEFDSWEMCCETAYDVMRDRLPDLSGGADHYFAPGGMVNGKPPAWARAMTPTVQYRGHLFFREG